jgi:hypothetical protein
MCNYSVGRCSCLSVYELVFRKLGLPPSSGGLKKKTMDKVQHNRRATHNVLHYGLIQFL